MSKLNLITKVRIEGVLVMQQEISPEEFKLMVEQKIVKVMDGIGFDRKKTA